MSLHPWIITSGILGNIISFMVYLAPLPTFVRVYRKKSTEGFQSIPYVVALLSSMLWVYYATLKPKAYLVLTINSLGCLVESTYIVFFLLYAPRKARILTVKLLVLLNIGGVVLLLLLTHFLAKGSTRVQIVGWCCVTLSASVFAAPLSVMRLVIRTKSVEFLPFTLSLFLTLNAVSWLIYGLLLKDFYVAIPNVLGLVFGIIQMALYVIYKKPKNKADQNGSHHQKKPLPGSEVVTESKININSCRSDGENNNTKQAAEKRQDQRSGDQVRVGSNDDAPVQPNEIAV